MCSSLVILNDPCSRQHQTTKYDLYHCFRWCKDDCHPSNQSKVASANSKAADHAENWILLRLALESSKFWLKISLGFIIDHSTPVAAHTTIVYRTAAIETTTVPIPQSPAIEVQETATMESFHSQTASGTFELFQTETPLRTYRRSFQDRRRILRLEHLVS